MLEYPLHFSYLEKPLCRYVAPEGSIGCVKADVYAFGIVLAQLVSGRKAVDAAPGDQQQSIREWVRSY